MPDFCVDLHIDYREALMFANERRRDLREAGDELSEAAADCELGWVDIIGALGDALTGSSELVDRAEALVEAREDWDSAMDEYNSALGSLGGAREAYVDCMRCSGQDVHLSEDPDDVDGID